ncbi:hypothetical protein HDK77DRAFT_23763 [Phyllosticta capitalensis]
MFFRVSTFRLPHRRSLAAAMWLPAVAAALQCPLPPRETPGQSPLPSCATMTRVCFMQWVFDVCERTVATICSCSPRLREDARLYIETAKGDVLSLDHITASNSTPVRNTGP